MIDDDLLDFSELEKSARWLKIKFIRIIFGQIETKDKTTVTRKALTSND